MPLAASRNEFVGADFKNTGRENLALHQLLRSPRWSLAPLAAAAAAATPRPARRRWPKPADSRARNPLRRPQPARLAPPAAGSHARPAVARASRHRGRRARAALLVAVLEPHPAGHSRSRRATLPVASHGELFAASPAAYRIELLDWDAQATEAR
ncbi:hypothetical protein PVAP13_2KG108501 [Panicum virgatum]|uniref:Uncharacterized protein n=1 Tax=Panicum virgatum TaxID=38727 RepID=A0A8T0WNY6_PANVG|nr:hypothetical protein PVAP13_2KG108501 [Panicum virgatum]